MHCIWNGTWGSIAALWALLTLLIRPSSGRSSATSDDSQLSSRSAERKGEENMSDSSEGSRDTCTNTEYTVSQHTL